MPTSLALGVDAPMQSWGTRSRGIIRDTATEPTKSGVVGLLAAALGTPRADVAKIQALAALDLGVRVDREGMVERDYHTTQNVPTTLGTGHRTVVSERYYLADALFLVVLGGDPELLTALYRAVQEPRWPLCFGRRAFVPARPLVGPEEAATGAGLLDLSVDQALHQHRWLEHPDRAKAELAKDDPMPLRTVVDCPASDPLAQVRHDVPLSFAHHRREFAHRTVLAGHVPLTRDLITPGGPACS